METIISEQIFQPKNLLPDRLIALEEDFHFLFNQIENLNVLFVLKFFPFSFIKQSTLLSFQLWKKLWKSSTLNYLPYVS